MHSNVSCQFDAPTTHERIDWTMYQRSANSTVEWAFVAIGIFF